MIAAIQSYMDEEAFSDQLDDTLAEIASGTNDATVKAVRRAVWGFYDDVVNHPIVASKEQWAYLNRILLLLRSDAEAAVARGRFRLPHCAALLALVGYLCVSAWMGFSVAAMIRCAVPFGFVSMALAGVQRRTGTTHTSKPPTTPFPTFGSLAAVRRSVEHFEGKNYPRALANRRLRSRMSDILLWSFWIPGWLFLSPLVLIVQALPDREFRLTSL